MKRKRIFTQIALAAGLALCAFIPAERGALAAPNFDKSLAAPAEAAPAIEKTRWVCGHYRCWWRPGWRYWHRGYYWHRPWHRWHRWHHWHGHRHWR